MNFVVTDDWDSWQTNQSSSSDKLDPEYDNAEYELQFHYPGVPDDLYPHRFNVKPPDDLFEHGEAVAWEWVRKHTLRPHLVWQPSGHVTKR